MAADFVRSYENTYPNATIGYTVGRDIIDQILAQPGCAGLRFYNAINEFGQTTLVYVGVDAQGNDMMKTVTVDTVGNISEQNAIVADRVGGTPTTTTTTPWWWPF